MTDTSEDARAAFRARHDAILAEVAPDEAEAAEARNPREGQRPGPVS